MKINFVGDLIIGDQPVKFGYGFDSCHAITSYNGVFDNVMNYLTTADYTIGNFESVIKVRPKTTNLANWAMCCDDRIIEQLKAAKVNVLNVANNHLMDYGDRGFNTTVDVLKMNGIKVLGLKDKPFCILENKTKTLKIAVAGVSYLKTSCKNPLYFYQPNETDWERVIREIEKEGADKKILFIHWGNEFVKNPVEKQMDIVKSLKKFRFDAIIGHHPHVLQPFGLIDNIPVFFSLGNFVSDYWQDRARKSVILRGKFENELAWEIMDCKLDSKGIPFKESGFYDVELDCFNDSISTKKDIYLARRRLRFEYLKELFKNGYKIKHKLSFLYWILHRVTYVLKYWQKEKKNPDIIYEKY